MPLAETLKRDLRRRGHTLKPVVLIGSAGLTEAVVREIDLSLEHHELMKVRVAGMDRRTKQRLIASICESCHADLVQSIGHIALLYRKKVNPRRGDRPKRAPGRARS